MQGIKFRVWDKKREKFCNPKNVVIDCHNGNIHGNKSSGNADDWIVEQFTGKQDKNGKDIYEGDICIFNHRISKLNGKGMVYWSDSGCCWMVKTILPFCLHTAMLIEIIGNIHQNPELWGAKNANKN